MARGRLVELRRDEGISLAELIVAIMVFGIVLAVVTTTFISLTKATAQARSIDANTRAASNGMSELTRVVRGARTVPVPASVTTGDLPAFTEAKSESLTVATAANLDTSITTAPRRAQFVLDGSRRLIENVTAAQLYQTSYYQFTGATTSRTLTGPVATAASSGAPLFTYYDVTGVKLVAADPSAGLTRAQMDTIGSVAIALSIDSTTTFGSSGVTLTNTVGLPNLDRGAKP